jgi:hypothetical protein
MATQYGRVQAAIREVSRLIDQLVAAMQHDKSLVCKQPKATDNRPAVTSCSMPEISAMMCTVIEQEQERQPVGKGEE